MQKKMKIALACFLGAAIGTMIAWELNPWLCWVGLIAGALMGYLAYDWREVLAKLPVAYRTARGWIPGETAKMRFWYSVMVLFCAASGFALAFPMTKLRNELPVVNNVFTMTVIMCMFAFLIAVFTNMRADTVHQHDPEEHEESETARLAAFYALPPVTAYCLLKALLWLGWRGICALPRAKRAVQTAGGRFFRFLGRFFWKLFLILMSEERLVCLFGGALGTLTGIFAGMAMKSGGSLPYGLSHHGAGLLLSLGCGVVGAGLGLLFHYVVAVRILAPRGYVRIKAS